MLVCKTIDKKSQTKHTRIPKIRKEEHISLLLSSSATSSLLLPNLHLPSSSLSRSILNPFSSLLFFSTRIYVFSFVFFSIYLMVIWIICFLFSSLGKLNIKLRFLFFLIVLCFLFLFFNY
jgi:hypothetical protein